MPIEFWPDASLVPSSPFFRVELLTVNGDVVVSEVMDPDNPDDGRCPESVEESKILGVLIFRRVHHEDLQDHRRRI